MEEIRKKLKALTSAVAEVQRHLAHLDLAVAEKERPINLEVTVIDIDIASTHDYTGEDDCWHVPTDQL